MGGVTRYDRRECGLADFAETIALSVRFVTFVCIATLLMFNAKNEVAWGIGHGERSRSRLLFSYEAITEDILTLAANVLADTFWLTVNTRVLTCVDIHMTRVETDMKADL